MAKRERVLVREFDDSFYGKDAYVLNTPVVAQSTRGSPGGWLHGFSGGSFKDRGVRADAAPTFCCTPKKGATPPSKEIPQTTPPWWFWVKRF